MKIPDSLKDDVEEQMRGDPAHDFEHVMRVYRNAQKICKKEGANERLVLAAALLHDVVSWPKSGRRSKTSSIQSAKNQSQS